MIQFGRLLHTKFDSHIMYVILQHKKSIHMYKFTKGMHLNLKQNSALRVWLSHSI
jgi:hypothetical protein